MQLSGFMNRDFRAEFKIACDDCGQWLDDTAAVCWRGDVFKSDSCHYCFAVKCLCPECFEKAEYYLPSNGWFKTEEIGVCLMRAISGLGGNPQDVLERTKILSSI